MNRAHTPKSNATYEQHWVTKAEHRRKHAAEREVVTSTGQIAHTC